MAVLFFARAAVLFFMVISVVIAEPLAVLEDGFVFPVPGYKFPKISPTTSFIDNKTLKMPGQDCYLEAFFAIPLNESNLAHEIDLIPSNATQPSFPYNEKIINFHDGIIYLTLFINDTTSFFWKNVNGSIVLTNYHSSCEFYTVKSRPKSMKIQLYTNGTAIYDDENTCDLPILYNFTHGNYFYIPFNILWYHADYLILKMGNGIKLAFYEGQYEDPPKEKEWPLLPISTTTPPMSTSTTPSTTTSTSTSTSTTPTTTTKLPPTLAFPYSEPEFDFSIFIQQNYDLLIIIAVLCFLILFCSMAAIFLCSCFKSK